MLILQCIWNAMAIASQFEKELNRVSSMMKKLGIKTMTHQQNAPANDCCRSPISACFDPGDLSPPGVSAEEKEAWMNTGHFIGVEDLGYAVPNFGMSPGELKRALFSILNNVVVAAHYFLQNPSGNMRTLFPTVSGGFLALKGSQLMEYVEAIKRKDIPIPLQKTIYQSLFVNMQLAIIRFALFYRQNHLFTETSILNYITCIEKEIDLLTEYNELDVFLENAPKVMCNRRIFENLFAISTCLIARAAEKADEQVRSNSALASETCQTEIIRALVYDFYTDRDIVITECCRDGPFAKLIMNVDLSRIEESVCSTVSFGDVSYIGSTKCLSPWGLNIWSIFESHIDIYTFIAGQIRKRISVHHAEMFVYETLSAYKCDWAGFIRVADEISASISTMQSVKYSSATSKLTCVAMGLFESCLLSKRNMAQLKKLFQARNRAYEILCGLGNDLEIVECPEKYSEPLKQTLSVTYESSTKRFCVKTLGGLSAGTAQEHSEGPKKAKKSAARGAQRN